MSRPENSFRWSTVVRDLAPDRSSSIVSADANSATCLLFTPSGHETVLKLSIGDQRRRDDLAAAWNALTLLSESDDSPAPQPLRWHTIDDTGLAIELSYVPGAHPDFESEKDFFVFGATIARLHKITRGKRLKSGRAWDMERISIHYADPALLRLFSEREKAVALRSLEAVAPVYNRYLDDGVWTGISIPMHTATMSLYTKALGASSISPSAGKVYFFGILAWPLQIPLWMSPMSQNSVAVTLSVDTSLSSQRQSLSSLPISTYSQQCGAWKS